MPLSVGQSLSFYEILGSLGAGAMGEVYRAKDTRLDREAKSLASLNHPSVAQIYGVDQVEDTS
jgi:serine/threonine protein kinase